MIPAIFACDTLVNRERAIGSLERGSEVVAQTVNASTCSVFILAVAPLPKLPPNVESGQAFEEAC